MQQKAVTNKLERRIKRDCRERGMEGGSMCEKWAYSCVTGIFLSF